MGEHGSAVRVVVRPERREDAAAVARVHAAAFAGRGDGASGGQAGVPAEVGLVEALRRSGDLDPRLSMVAEVDGEVVGHVAVSRGTPDGLVGLGPLGVLPRLQGRGVGSALMHSVVAAAEAHWYVGVVLLGDPAFYGRFGFDRADEHGLVPEHDWPREAFLVRPLPSSWPGGYPPGTVFRYAPAFDALS